MKSIYGQLLTLTSHMVHVVSTEHVPIRVGSTSFQSNEVKGAQYSVIKITKNNYGDS
jgi:hypothetical protein